MSDKANDGGPAFPFSSMAPTGPTIYEDNKGMSIRDWFARQALSGMTANPMLISNSGGFSDKNFRACYFMADAMLAERERGMK